MKKIFLSAITIALSANSFATSTPIFLVVPKITAPTNLFNGEITTAVYQITNNSPYDLSNIGLAQMPAGVNANINSVSNVSNYCTNPFNLAKGASCLLKLNINNAVSTGPIVCYSQSQPVYCSQPFATEQLAISISQNAIPQDCNSNVANFNYELTQNFDSTNFVTGWGPERNPLYLSPANPNLTNCAVTAGISWQQQRIMAAAAFWIAQKLNYCHHYNPDYQTPVSGRGAGETSAGYCSAALDTMPGSVYYGQQARWNYSGQGSETQSNWVNNNQMWYGMDCSNTTSFIYNFALGPNATLGIPFDSKTNYQAGQTSSGNQDQLTPNQQVPSDPNQILNNPNAAGLLICADGTTDPNPSSPSMCAGHGGYLSGINSSGTFTKSLTPTQMATVLQPGDLMFIAGAGPSAPDQHPNPDGSTSIVTHVIMWTGKQVGYGPNNINPALVAPNDAPCANPSIWQPQVGDWLIADSHYQGYDYRVLTTCFYLNDLWGVRRVIR